MIYNTLGQVREGVEFREWEIGGIDREPKLLIFWVPVPPLSHQKSATLKGKMGKERDKGSIYFWKSSTDNKNTDPYDWKRISLGRC